MEYTQIPPPETLQHHVRYFWTLESRVMDLTPKTLGPLADGCPGLIFQPAEKGIFYDQDEKQLPEVFLYGQTVKRTALRLVGAFRTTGVCFHPNTLPSVFGFHASELTDACLDLNLLSARLPEQLLHTTQPVAQATLLSAYLLSRIQKTNNPPDRATRYAVSLIMRSGGTSSLKQLQTDLNITERSLERRFNQHVGISPKLFSKICRFQASLHQLRHNQYDKLSDIAYDNGFADQSHFIRTFKAFAGFAPCQFQQQLSELPENAPVLVK